MTHAFGQPDDCVDGAMSLIQVLAHRRGARAHETNVLRQHVRRAAQDLPARGLCDISDSGFGAPLAKSRSSKQIG